MPISGVAGGCRGRIGFESRHLVFEACSLLQRLRPKGVALFPLKETVEPLREIKEAGEIRLIKRALGITRRALRFVLILTIPMGIGSFFVAHDLIGLIFGDDFVEAGVVMGILMCAIHLQFLSHVLNASVVARGKENYVALGAAIAVAANLALCVTVIPEYGYVGAAVTTVASQGVLVAFLLFVQRDNVVALARQLKLARVAAANVVLLGVCFLLREQGMLVIIPAAVAAYSGAVLALRCIDKDELKAVLGR